MTVEPTSASRAVRVFRGIAVVALGALVAFFVYTTTANPDSRFPFRLGLDLTGGTQLVYDADTSALADADAADAMATLREIIERRVNAFGVGEPIVQVERAGLFAAEGSDWRLIVELPGFTDVQEATRFIGETPLLEFKLVNPAWIVQQYTDAIPTDVEPEQYLDTGLTGRYLDRSQLVFGAQGSGMPNEPIVQVEFNEEGAELFATITRDNVGNQLAIFLDGESVSEPFIREPIAGGIATISGGFTPEEARTLVRNLNIGALPVPVSLLSSELVGASLGADTLAAGLNAGMIGFALVVLFMIAWYRLPGVVASVALVFYVAATLSIFKLIGVVLTAPGIAAFILSVGMAVDANVLIFERIKDELRSGKALPEALRDGFSRAWLAIRDGHVTSIFSAIILFWVGTSMVKGFALVYGIGVLLSLLSGITVTRTLLLALGLSDTPLARRLFGSGFSKK